MFSHSAIICLLRVSYSDGILPPADVGQWRADVTRKVWPLGDNPVSHD